MIFQRLATEEMDVYGVEKLVHQELKDKPVEAVEVLFGSGTGGTVRALSGSGSRGTSYSGGSGGGAGYYGLYGNVNEVNWPTSAAANGGARRKCRRL